MVTGNVQLQKIFAMCMERDGNRKDTVIDGKAVRGADVGRGLSMTPVGLFRNFVLERFDTDEDQRKVYAERWLPLERACVKAGPEESEEGEMTTTVAGKCERFFAEALDASTREVLREVLLQEFIKWWDGEGGAGGGGERA